MSIICLDVESFYSKDFSLSKMTTEAYVRDPQFQVIGFAYSIDGATPVWVTGSDEVIEARLHELELQKHSLICHNMAFDGAILAWRYGILPKQYFDTLSMARPVHGHTVVGGSLAKLAKHYGLGVKGTEILQAVGKRRAQFGFTELHQYGEYCKNDVMLTWELFHKLLPHVPKNELYIIDLLIRMYTDPVLKLDRELLDEHLTNVRERKTELLARVQNADKDILMSNPKFAALLEKLGVVPPMKESPANGKQTYAFAKTDPAFKALAEHDDPRVQAVVAARLGVKSTLEETRTESMIRIADRGTLPIMLQYYGAATGRCSGGDKMNLQNLPSRGGMNTIRRSIMAPAGHKLVVCDSSQIEARIVAWLAGEADMVQAFADRQDVYKLMGSKLYNKPVEEIDKQERFIAKTVVLGCIGEGTPVLCDSGWKPIEQVSLDDKLWDGEEWVCHQGLVDKGTKKTLNLCGAWLTPDHKVWSGTHWLEAQSVVRDEGILYQALVRGTENLPSQAIYRANEAVSMQSLRDAIAAKLNTLLTRIILKTSRALGATYAPSNQVSTNARSTGGTQKLCPTTNTGSGYLTESTQLSCGLPTQTTRIFRITGVEESAAIANGSKTDADFSSTLQPYPDGKHSFSNWIELTTTRVTSRATCAFVAVKTTLTTAVEYLKCSLGSQNSRKKLPTYDIAYAGPRNRFTILTDSGPLIVHNCGYGMSAEKFRDYIGLQGVALSEDEASEIIKTYRKTNSNIVQLWRDADQTLMQMVYEKSVTLGSMELVADHKGFHLPNGMIIEYPGLRRDTAARGFLYDSKYGIKKLYGAAAVENIVQALARIVVFTQMCRMDKMLRERDTPKARYKTVLSVHDETVVVVPEADAKWALDALMDIMYTPPGWAQGLPVACEGSIADRYGDAK